MREWFKDIEKPILALAPMHQVSRSGLRQQCRSFGADATFSEMVAAEAVIRHVPQTFEMMRFTERERPFIVQIFGNKPEIMAQAAKLIEKEINPDGIDINFGCPVQKAEKQGFGSCQLKDPVAAGKIVKAVSKVLENIPLSVKIRIPSNDLEYSLGFVKAVYANGAKLISVHGRTPTQKYGGVADWNFAYEVKKKFPDLIVLGNGDIKTLDNLKEKLGNLDGAMIGRAAKIRPEVFVKLSSIKSNRRHVG
jgi:tRNA-dihydrouridine synthase B